MRKIVMSLMLLAIAHMGMSQDWQNKPAKIFANAAAAEFDLSDEQKQKAYELKLEEMAKVQAVNDEFKAGKSKFKNEEELKEGRKKVTAPYTKKYMEIFGVQGGEFWKWMVPMYKEMFKK